MRRLLVIVGLVLAALLVALGGLVVVVNLTDSGGEKRQNVPAVRIDPLEVTYDRPLEPIAAALVREGAEALPAMARFLGRSLPAGRLYTLNVYGDLKEYWEVVS